MTRVVTAHVEQLAAVNSYTILNTQYGMLMDEASTLYENAKDESIKESAEDIVEGCRIILDNFKASGDKEVFKAGLKKIQEGSTELDSSVVMSAAAFTLDIKEPANNPVADLSSVAVPEIQEGFDEISVELDEANTVHEELNMLLDETRDH